MPQFPDFPLSLCVQFSRFVASVPFSSFASGDFPFSNFPSEASRFPALPLFRFSLLFSGFASVPFLSPVFPFFSLPFSRFSLSRFSLPFSRFSLTKRRGLPILSQDRREAKASLPFFTLPFFYNLGTTGAVRLRR